MPESEPRVSIIMRAKNTGWVIHQALAALYSQTFKDFELVVVDSGSTDNTLDIVRCFPHRLIQIEASDYFPGAVLNAVIQETRSGLIVFQNADTVPLTPYALQRLLDVFDDEKTQAAFARQIPRPEAFAWVRRDYDTAFPEFGPAPEWMTLSLPLAAMRRSIWREHPFFTDAWGSEDVEWGYWAKTHGHGIRYVADALVMHSHNYTLRQIYGRRFIEGEADAFIHQSGDSWARLIRRYFSSIAHDGIDHGRRREWKEIVTSPLRRAVYQWAYYQGRTMGEQRRRSGNPDASIGQKIVLTRHESNRS